MFVVGWLDVFLTTYAAGSPPQSTMLEYHVSTVAKNQTVASKLVV